MPIVPRITRPRGPSSGLLATDALADVAAQVLPVAQQNVPAHIRVEDWVPFGPVVEPAADAGPTEQLANWLGRTTR